MDDNSYRMGEEGGKVSSSSRKRRAEEKVKRERFSLSLWKYKFRSSTDTR